MVLLIFALHLRTLAPPLLSQIKQCLLEVANLYALAPPTLNSNRRNFDSSVDDIIGLCYFQCSANSSSDELKIVYSPRGKGFSLRDFHYAVNRLPSDSYLPPLLEDSFLFCDLDISCLLSHELLHCTGGKDIDRKIVLISSCLVANIDSIIRKCLLDAADKCVSVEFVFLEQNSNQLSDISDSINKFRGQICDLENCSFNAYLPDGHVFNGLVKRWVGELKTDDIMQRQAHLVFQRGIIGSINEIICKLCNSTNYIMDGFSPCKCCRCSRVGRDHQMFKDHFPCYDGNVNREPEHTNSHSMKVDEHTLLSKESWWSWMGHCPVSSAVYLNVTERTSLASLSEGVMVGKPYILIPSVSMETDTTNESDKCQLNNSLFQGVCRALYSLNQGLVCWTSCNIETMRETTIHYYYILQPSDHGLMLLRRLAGAEEILPFPDLNESDSSVAEEIDNYVQQCLQEVELRDYNPVQHIGGFHQTINQLVLQSSQSGLVNSDITITAPDITCFSDPSIQPSLATNVPTPQGGVSPVTQALENDSEIVDLTQQWEQLVGRSTPKMNSMPSKRNPEKCLSEEWEKLIVGGSVPMDSLSSEPNLEDSRTSTVTHRPLDTRTSKILERLGNPKHIKTKVPSPTVVSNISTNAGSMTETRLSVQTVTASQGLMTTSCLLKPTFHRLKRKQW